MANKLQICTWLLETCHRIPGVEMPSGMVAVFLTAFHRLSWDGSSWSWPYVLLGPVTGRRTVRLMSCLQAEKYRTVCWSYCPGQPAAIQHTINLISSRHYIRINLIKFYSHTVSHQHYKQNRNYFSILASIFYGGKIWCNVRRIVVKEKINLIVCSKLACIRCYVCDKNIVYMVKFGIKRQRWPCYSYLCTQFNWAH